MSRLQLRETPAMKHQSPSFSLIKTLPTSCSNYHERTLWESQLPSAVSMCTCCSNGERFADPRSLTVDGVVLNVWLLGVKPLKENEFIKKTVSLLNKSTLVQFDFFLQFWYLFFIHLTLSSELGLWTYWLWSGHFDYHTLQLWTTVCFSVVKLSNMQSWRDEFHAARNTFIEPSIIFHILNCHIKLFNRLRWSLGHKFQTKIFHYENKSQFTRI
jgi:hypothetical protein